MELFQVGGIIILIAAGRRHFKCVLVGAFHRCRFGFVFARNCGLFDGV